MGHDYLNTTKEIQMNTSTKQLNSVVNFLRPLAYEEVFVHETSNENWIRLEVQADKLTRAGVAMMFPTYFQVAMDAHAENVLFVRNSKIS